MGKRIANLTVEDLKKHLGPGIGLRKNKYVVEIPYPGLKGRTLALLCQSAFLPEKNIGTVDVYYRGRRYKVRGETDFTGTFTLNFVDDSSMSVRKYFDKWMTAIDNTEHFARDGILTGTALGELANVANGILKAANKIKSSVKANNLLGFGMNMLSGNPGLPVYQSEINVWQLSKDCKKIGGYKLTNAYPVELGGVELSDSVENSLLEFSVTFAYSEHEPIYNESLGKQIFNGVFGSTGKEIVSGVEDLFG